MLFVSEFFNVNTFHRCKLKVHTIKSYFCAFLLQLRFTGATIVRDIVIDEGKNLTHELNCSFSLFHLAFSYTITILKQITTIKLVLPILQ